MKTKWWLVIRRSALDVSLWGCTGDNRWKAVATLEAERDLVEAVSLELASHLFGTVDDAGFNCNQVVSYPAWDVTCFRDSDVPAGERLRYRDDVRGKESGAFGHGATRELAASIIKRLSGANKRVIFSGKMPSPDVVDLCLKLAEADGKSDRAIARDFTRGDAKKADSLLTQIRTLRRENRVRFE